MTEADVCDLCQRGPTDVLLVAGLVKGARVLVCGSCLQVVRDEWPGRYLARLSGGAASLVPLPDPLPEAA